MGKSKEIGSKKKLEMILSRLLGFSNSKVRDEQYITPSDIAAEVLWNGLLDGRIEGKVIVDLGCGTGVLGIGCLLLGAKRVTFIDKDIDAISICKENIAKLESEGCFEVYPLNGEGKESEKRVEIIKGNIGEYNQKADMVITNPPFGTKVKHSDKEFLLHAFKLSNVTYSFHKTSTKEYISHLAKKNKYNVGEIFDFKFMLWNTMKHHTRARKYIDVSCFVCVAESMNK